MGCAHGLGPISATVKWPGLLWREASQSLSAEGSAPRFPKSSCLQCVAKQTHIANRHAETDRDLYFYSSCYACAVGICAGDLVLRFIWALSIFGGVPGRGFGMFFFEVVELARRTVWAVFRIEWEVIVKVHLPSGQDLMPLRAEISTLSEEEGEGT